MFDDPISGNATYMNDFMSSRPRNFTPVEVRTRSVDGAVVPHQIILSGKTYTITRYMGCRHDDKLNATEHGICIGKRQTKVWCRDGKWFVELR